MSQAGAATLAYWSEHREQLRQSENQGSPVRKSISLGQNQPCRLGGGFSVWGARAASYTSPGNQIQGREDKIRNMCGMIKAAVGEGLGVCPGRRPDRPAIASAFLNRVRRCRLRAG